MAIATSRVKDVPKDAIILTEEQVGNFYFKEIINWENPSEIWSLRYGTAILAGISALTGIYINNHFRTKLKLGSTGQISSYLPVVGLPASLAAFYHSMFIQRTIYTKPGQCEMCIGLKASVIQATLGILYPLITAPLASAAFATRLYTYRIPDITKNPIEVLRVFRRMCSPISNSLIYLTFGHIFITLFLTNKEIEHFFKIRSHMVRNDEMN